MQEPTFLILAALAAEPLHGYGVILEVTQLSAGRVTLRPGTLYGALDRLVAGRRDDEEVGRDGMKVAYVRQVLADLRGAR